MRNYLTFFSFLLSFLLWLNLTSQAQASETCVGAGVNATQAQRVFLRNCGVEYDTRKGHECYRTNSDPAWGCKGEVQLCKAEASKQYIAEQKFEETCGVAYDKTRGHYCYLSTSDGEKVSVCQGKIDASYVIPSDKPVTQTNTSAPSTTQQPAATNFPTETCAQQGDNEIQAQRVFATRCGLDYREDLGHSCKKLSSGRWECSGLREICSTQGSNQGIAEQRFQDICGIAYDKSKRHDCRLIAGNDVECSGDIVPGSATGATTGTTANGGSSGSGNTTDNNDTSSGETYRCIAKGTGLAAAQSNFATYCGTTYDPNQGHFCRESNNGAGKWMCIGETTYCSVQRSTISDAQRVFGSDCGMQFNTALGHTCFASGNGYLCASSGGTVSQPAPTPTAEPKPTPTPTTNIGGSSKSFDMKYASTHGSKGLSPKRSSSVGLCKAIHNKNDTYFSQNQFTFPYGGKNYTVHNVARKYGAMPNSGDVTAKLKNAFSGISGSSNSPGVLYFPNIGGKNTYFYSDIMSMYKSNVILCGGGSTIKSTNLNGSTIEMSGDNIHVIGLRVVAARGTSWPEEFAADPNTHPAKFGSGSNDVGRLGGKSYLIRFSGGSKNIVVADSYFYGGRGFRIYSTNGGQIYDNVIERTFSDGIQVAHSVSNLVLWNNRILNAGDDCISIVNYSKGWPNKTPNKNILVESNTCIGGRARGLTIIGGENITHRGNYISGMLESGILVFTSASHSDHPSDNVLITQNYLVNNYRVPKRFTYRGGLAIVGHKNESGPLMAQNIAVYKNYVVDTATSGAATSQLFVKNDGRVKNVSIEKNRLYGRLRGLDNTNTNNNVSYIDNSYSVNGPGSIDMSLYGSTLK